VNSSTVTLALVPPGVVTKTSYSPAAWAGEVAVIWVDATTVKLVAATVPKSTLVAPVNPVPVMVTLVPPDVGPEVGEREVTVGVTAGAT
jgi:hypothetical protein